MDTAPATPRARWARVRCLVMILLHALHGNSGEEGWFLARRSNCPTLYFRKSSLKAAVASAQRMSSISRDRLSALDLSSSSLQLAGCWLSS